MFRSSLGTYPHMALRVDLAAGAGAGRRRPADAPAQFGGHRRDHAPPPGQGGFADAAEPDRGLSDRQDRTSAVGLMPVQHVGAS